MLIITGVIVYNKHTKDIKMVMQTPSATYAILRYGEKKLIFIKESQPVINGHGRNFKNELRTYLTSFSCSCSILYPK